MGTERAQTLIRRDPDLTNTLASQGLSLRSRPSAGQAVELKRVINDNCADGNESANGYLCGAILDTTRRAAAVLGLRLAGVDVICQDPLVPLEQSGGAIIDVNATPGFYYHYRRVGTSFPVADHVLQRFFAASAPYGS
jgi:cyanophycin synthetase